MTNETTVTWNCRHHPTDWWHEVGCPHQEWSKDQLYNALITAKKSNAMKLDFIQASNRASVEEAKQATDINLYSNAIRVAHGNTQTVGENNDYYITLKQLEHLIKQAVIARLGDTPQKEGEK